MAASPIGAQLARRRPATDKDHDVSVAVADGSMPTDPKGTFEDFDQTLGC